MEKKVGDVENKIPDISGLVTTTVLNTKTGEVENKIPDTSGLVTTNNLLQESERSRIKFLLKQKTSRENILLLINKSNIIDENTFFHDYKLAIEAEMVTVTIILRIKRQKQQKLVINSLELILKKKTLIYLNLSINYLGATNNRLID